MRWGRTRVELLAYSADCVSFLLQRLPPDELAGLKQIVLFGSAARGDTDAESDVDLFLDTQRSQTLEAKARRLVDEFEQSIKVTRYWKLLGITANISIKVGDLAAWSALHPALLKDGRVLYGPFTGVTPALGNALALLAWQDVHSLASRTNLYRGLHGYASRGHRYTGLLDLHKGQRIAKGSILVPLSALDDFKAFFNRLKVPVKIRVLYELAATAETNR